MTAVRPENYKDPTPAQIAKQKDRGIPLQMLEMELEKAKKAKKLVQEARLIRTNLK